jgi:hypothetical protein
MQLRLNGWQRIGVIVSIMWAIGGWIGANMSASRDLEEGLGFHYKICDETNSIAIAAHRPAIENCQAGADKWAAIIQSEHAYEAPIVALVPIPIGWGLVYAVLAIVAWVRKGFRKPAA